MRHNYYMGKSAKRKHNKALFQNKADNNQYSHDSSQNVSKMSAYEVDYDFYFKNNQGMFLV
jgi:hypothetical protein